MKGGRKRLCGSKAPLDEDELLLLLLLLLALPGVEFEDGGEGGLLEGAGEGRWKPS